MAKRKATDAALAEATAASKAKKPAHLDEADLNDDDIQDDESNDGDYVEEPSEDEMQTEQVQEGENGHPASRGNAGGSSEYRAPTADEMLNLKETTSLFKSNLFKLQVEELLKEVNINYTKLQTLEKTLHKVKEIFDSIGDVPQGQLSEVTTKLDAAKISIPFPSPAPSKDTKVKFTFHKPEKLYIVGSYMLRTATKNPNLTNVDVAVQMHESMFQEKDWVNFRYFHKRAYFVAMLALALKRKASELPINIEYQWFNGDERRPILVLKGVERSEYDISKAGFCIRILPMVSPQTFSPTRFAPARNCVRPNSADDSSNTNLHTQVPTPRYNTSLLMDSAYVTHMNFIHHHAKNCAAFRDACVLAKVWLAQRGWTNGSLSEFGGFLWEMIMGWLLSGGGSKGAGKRLNNSFSSYQLFKVTLEFLATRDFDAEPLFLTPNGQPLSEPEFSKEAFQANFDVVIVDVSGRLNLAGHMSKAALEEFQHQARLGIACLNDNVEDRFDELFLKKVDDLHLCYDALVSINPSGAKPPNYKLPNSLDCAGTGEYLYYQLPHLLKRALTTRVTSVCVRKASTPSWSCSTTSAPTFPRLYIGLNLNLATCTRLVDLGPSREKEAELAEFRRIWGPKAELRRFKDGSILESVVWQTSGNSQDEDRHMIVPRMVKYLMKRHGGFEREADVLVWFGQYYPFIKPVAGATPASENLTFKSVMTAFDIFTKRLKALEDLPLSVVNVIPSSSALRYASMHVPQPIDPDSMVPNQFQEALDVLVEFESSGRWPDDYVAVQEMKIAFYVKMAELFEKEYPRSKAYVTVADEGVRGSMVENRYVDIVSEDGYTFRCRILHDREEYHLQQLQQRVSQPTPAALLTVKGQTEDKSAAEKLLSSELAPFRRTLQLLPAHSTRVRNLCLLNPFLSQTIRIAKRWVGSHLLSNLIPEEIIEMVCIRVFQHPAPWSAPPAALTDAEKEEKRKEAEDASPPASAWTGFNRVVDFLARWDWVNEPLIVELEKGTLTSDVRARIVENFQLARSRSVGGAGKDKDSSEMMNLVPAMFVASEVDEGCALWDADAGNTVVVAQRLATIARATVKLANAQVLADDCKTVSKCFVSPTAGYHAILRLNPKLCPRFPQSLSYDSKYSAAGKVQYKNLTKVTPESVFLKYVDPVQVYLKELETAFSHVAVFFHDKYGGDAIGVLWKPLLAQQSFKVNLKFSHVPVAASLEDNAKKGKGNNKGGNSASKDVTPNYMGIVAEFERLGAGLVTAVEVAHKL
ncbi:hypothetical protein HK102_009907 [Quaeritorhiza haematococci]|nr:hypothetical protein HK102_009907 [Quaeritorhiza haematococci]